MVGPIWMIPKAEPNKTHFFSILTYFGQKVLPHLWWEFFSCDWILFKLAGVNQYHPQQLQYCDLDGPKMWQCGMKQLWKMMLLPLCLLIYFFEFNQTPTPARINFHIIFADLPFQLSFCDSQIDLKCALAFSAVCICRVDLWKYSTLLLIIWLQ